MAGVKHLEQLSDKEYADIEIVSFKLKKLYPKLVPDHVIFDNFVRDLVNNAYHSVKAVDAKGRNCYVNYTLVDGETVTTSTLVGWNNPRSRNYKKKDKLCLCEVEYV